MYSIFYVNIYTTFVTINLDGYMFVITLAASSIYSLDMASALFGLNV